MLKHMTEREEFNLVFGRVDLLVAPLEIRLGKLASNRIIDQC